MILTLIITASILAYAFMGGIFGRWVLNVTEQRCGDCRRNRDCYKDHEMSAFFFGLGWPVVLPAVIGGRVGNYFTTGQQRAEDKQTRKDREHQNRLAELEAERVLAREQKEKTLADIRFLAENGIKAEVPGLYEES